MEIKKTAANGTEDFLQGVFQFFSASITLSISAFLVFVFFLQLIPNFTELFSLHSGGILLHFWQIVTSMFLHDGILHLASNLLALLVFGFLLEEIISKEDFAVAFFLGGIVSAAVGIFFYPSMLGASGAIYALLGCLAALRPFLFVFAFGVPLPMLVAAAIYLAIDLVGLLIPSNVGHIGHLAGLAFGLAFGLLLRKKYPPQTREKNDLVLDENYFRKWEQKYMFRQ